jgi:hypothetical protein
VAHFKRRSPAPINKRNGYQGFRKPVREDFRSTCAYCLLEEKWAAGVENFEIDHFRPQSKFPNLSMNFYNLYWACHVCNRTKGIQWPAPKLRGVEITFVDLCAESFDDHFVERANGIWDGKTQAAKYSIEALRLNRPHLVEIRRLLRLASASP